MELLRHRANTEDSPIDVLPPLAAAIFDFEMLHIVKLIGSRSDTEVDIEFVANEAALDFLNRYVSERSEDVFDSQRIERVLKKIGRPRVFNAIRYSHQHCRDQRRCQRLQSNILALDGLESLHDSRADAEPSIALEIQELMVLMESKLDELDKEVFHLLLGGYAASEIGSTLGWNKKTAERLVKAVRDKLRDFFPKQQTTNNKQRATNKGQKAKGSFEGSCLVYS